MPFLFFSAKNTVFASVKHFAAVVPRQKPKLIVCVSRRDLTSRGIALWKSPLRPVEPSAYLAALTGCLTRDWLMLIRLPGTALATASRTTSVARSVNPW